MLLVVGAGDEVVYPPSKCLSVCLPIGVNVDAWKDGNGAGTYFC